MTVIVVDGNSIEIKGHAPKAIVCHGISVIANMVANYVKDNKWGKVITKDGYLKIYPEWPAKNGVSFNSIAYELFHEIDDNYSLTSNGMLRNSVQWDYRRLQNLAQGYGNSIEEMLYSKYTDAFVEVDDQQELREEYRGLSDILNGMSNGEIMLGYGHEKEYCAKKGRLEAETFAQFGRCLYEHNESVLPMFKDIFPNSYLEINETVKGIIK